ncbi:MAG: hypothetical protein IJ228_13490, partial [Succinivibrio sp.]|nr:hypothetical protein [Succinivibrio sp.]
FKQKADGKKPRVWDSDRLRGREFVQFVALAYYDFLYAKLKALKATLGQPTGDKKHDTETVLKEERALLKWLKARSLHEVLGWFDAVEITRLTGKGHPAIKIVTEQTRRDQLFLERLGYQGEMSPKNAA